MLSYREISRVIGIYLYFFTVTLIVPLFVSIYYEYFSTPLAHPQPPSTFAFIYTMVACGGTGIFFHRLSKGARGVFFKREAIALVVLIWFISGFFGSLPFCFSHTLNNFFDAYFETVSALTTTGASVMQAKLFDEFTGHEIPIFKTFSESYSATYSYYGNINPVRDAESGKILYSGVEAVSKGVLFWRSFMQWLGGMGIVVLFVAILPALGVEGKSLFETEVSGPSKDILVPRIKETASYLWKIYFFFTIMQIFLLMVTNSNMPLFDALTITFSTLSTGGFSVRNASIATYKNEWTEWIVIFFMLVGSINFSLYFQCMRGKIYRLFEPEFLTFISIVIITCGIGAIHLHGTQKFPLESSSFIEGETYSWSEAIRYGSFQSISSQSTTGFATANFDKWPLINQMLMFIVMYLGGMAGSTSGGCKTIRQIMAFRIIQNKTESMFRPQTVRTERIGNKEISTDVTLTVLSFMVILIALSVLSTFLFVLDGVGLETALTTTGCMINNIGLAFRAAGPTESFAFLSTNGKILSSLWMILGRLEFFAVLVILVPAFWKK